MSCLVQAARSGAVVQRAAVERLGLHRGSGLAKLDDRADDACTNLLALAAQAKGRNALVSIREELRDDTWFITEIYDLAPGVEPLAQEISFSVSECTFGWTAAFGQQGTNISARIQLNPDADVSASLLDEVKARWKQGIEDKWSYRFACCVRPACSSPVRAHVPGRLGDLESASQVRVKKGDGRSNLGLWHTDDSGDVASHEFGHLMGHPDEYSEPSVCPDRSPVDTGTVMDDNSEVVQRLCQPFCDRIGQDTTTA